MNGSEINLLRQEAKMARESLSKLLDISLRTLINWEKLGKKFKAGKPYVLALRVIFESILLKDKLQKITKVAYEIAPSRYVSIWLVCGHELMLMRDVAYHSDFTCYDKFLNDEIRKSIREKSLIVYPLKHNEVINEAGQKNIRNHPGKSKTESDTQYFKDGFCNSILHIPFFCETEIGARPAALLVLEERIEYIEDNDDKTNKKMTYWKPKGNDDKAYKEDEVDKLTKLLKKSYKNGIGKICKALDYYSPLYDDQKINY